MWSNWFGFVILSLGVGKMHFSIHALGISSGHEFEIFPIIHIM